MTKYLRVSSYMYRKPFLTYDFATAPAWIFLYDENLIFFFNQCTTWNYVILATTVLFQKKASSTSISSTLKTLQIYIEIQEKTFFLELKASLSSWNFIRKVSKHL